LENFTPVSATLGGVLIGLSAVLLWLFNGRIAGISGILGGLLAPGLRDFGWRAAFVLGLVAGPLAAMAALGDMPAVTITGSTGLLVAGGLLVGFGTRLGSGCTSGHGVCGLARLSPRSIAATGLFLAAALATVFVTRHVIGA
jgi:uncharacterized membrane protein YedE/YeeE